MGFEPESYLKVWIDSAVTMINELVHVIVSIKLPHTTFQIKMFVEIDGFGFANWRIELVRLVISRSEGQLWIISTLNKTEIWNRNQNLKLTTTVILTLSFLPPKNILNISQNLNLSVVSFITKYHFTAPEPTPSGESSSIFSVTFLFSIKTKLEQTCCCRSMERDKRSFKLFKGMVEINGNLPSWWGIFT